MRIDRLAVLDAATRLLAVNPGASTQEIAAAASISRASLHRLFPTRDALVEAIALLAVERTTDAIAAARLDDGLAIEAIARLTDAIVPIVHQFAFLATEAQLQKSDRIRKEDHDLDQVFVRLIRRAQDEGALRADLPSAWLLHAYGGLLYAATWAMQRGDVAPREAARLVLISFLEGAAPARSRPWPARRPRLRRWSGDRPMVKRRPAERGAPDRVDDQTLRPPATAPST